MGWSRNDKLQLTSIIISIVGFAFVFYQLYLATQQFHQAQMNQRAEHLTQLYFQSFNSGEIKDIFQKIEYLKFEFNPALHDSFDQKAVIQLLSFLELLAQLEKMEMLQIEEISEIFGYYAIRVYENEEVKKYLDYLRNTWKKDGIGFYGFERLTKSIIQYQGKRASQS